ncbi:MAG: pyridoxamine 5'-phosphate oxidase [Proteobacteria bacterium]|nr:pyridoxamine 5'-phosphate oxidase [Pseudomonadota bacterium]
MNDSASDLRAEALATFDRLFAEAGAAGEPDPTAMAVATTTLDGRPSLRMVLLKAHDERGFVFYTHLDGRKGLELQANPHAALLFFWPRVRNAVQVRIEGMVELVSDDQADAYFASRPRDSQIGAWASRQSQPLADRAEFEERFDQAQAEFAGRDVPRPPRWTGFRVRPERFEFWYGAEYRLHRRDVYVIDRCGDWHREQLYP